MKIKKILYIENFDTKWRTAVWVKKGFQSIGIKIKPVQESSLTKQGLIDIIDEFKPDLILIGKARTQFSLLEVFELYPDILTASWQFDLYFKTPRRTEVFSDRFKTDIVFTTDGGNQEEYERLGINQQTLRQGINEDDTDTDDKLECVEDIIFVGTNNPWYQYRNDLIKFLKKEYGDRFGWYGNKHQIRGKDLTNLVNSAKIVIGDSVYSDNYWSNRIYEMLGRGGFLIHPRVPGLEKEFKYYKHLIPYDTGNFNQLKSIIDYYLSHKTERNNIKKEGQKYCLENYKYSDRCKQFIEYVNKITRDSNFKKRSYSNRGQSSETENVGNIYPQEGSGNKEGSSRDGEDSRGNQTERNITRFNPRPNQSVGSSSRGDSSETKQVCSNNSNQEECYFRNLESYKATIVLLNYERPHNTKRLIEELKKQKGVELDIWVCDSGKEKNDFDAKTFIDPHNPGIFLRWELSRMASTKYVIMLDDDVHLCDDNVIKDLIDEKEKEPKEVIVGWRGVTMTIPGQKYTDCIHFKSEDKDQRAHIIKGQIFIVSKEQLEQSRSFPTIITGTVDSRTHGEIYYGLLWGNCQPIHLVSSKLKNRVENVIERGVGLEYRPDHYKKQNKHMKLCLELIQK
jgi:hypothetical protein